MPQLVDPNFVRSVVLIIDHSEKGAFGLIINHRLPTTIAEFADAVTLRWEGPADQGLRLGGPVEPVRAFLLHDQSQWDPLAEDVAPGAFLTASLEGVRRVSDNRFGGAGRNYLVFLGYAGWGPGQLESEMAQGSWLAVPCASPPARPRGPGAVAVRHCARGHVARRAHDHGHRPGAADRRERRLGPRAAGVRVMPSRA
ncbi:YqgE/AlgH family protein [Nannocystis pusilla]|uniref:YqgE/AlgH family protein n=1 Tax=Nannocystis pusilla TaxID=889268 RepID=UPI003B7EF181